MIRTIWIALLATVLQFAHGDNSTTNGVDWTCASSVIEHLGDLAEHIGVAACISEPELTNIAVSANQLWVECLNFNIETNDFAASALLLIRRKRVLDILAGFSSFSLSDTNVLQASNAMIERIRPVKSIGRGQPVARPPLFNPWPPIDVQPGDSPQRALEIAEWNFVHSNRYEQWKADYSVDLNKRKFYDNLQSLYRKLDFMLKCRQP